MRHQTGQTTERKWGSWEQLEDGNQQLRMYRCHNFTTSNNLSWWWRDWLALANPRHRLLFYDGKSDESWEMTWSKLKINTARWRHKRWGQDDDWYLGTRVTFILLKQVEEGAGRRDKAGWETTASLAMQSRGAKQRKQWRVRDGRWRAESNFLQREWTAQGAAKRMRSVSFLARIFCTARGDQHHESSFWEPCMCHFGIFFKSFILCRFVPFTNNVSTCRERKRGAKNLATDLCRFQFPLSFILYD